MPSLLFDVLPLTTIRIVLRELIVHIIAIAATNDERRQLGSAGVP